MKRIHPLVVVLLFVAVAAAVSLVTSGPDSANTFFSYTTNPPANRYVHVATGEELAVPFSFQIGESAEEVSLEFEDDVLPLKGVVLEERNVAVEGGYASSRAIFRFRSQNDIEPGTYSVKIVARDDATGEIIRTGKIPFIVDIIDIIATCSC